MRNYLLIGICLGLAACGGGEEKPPEPYQDRETVFDPMVDTMDRARAVEDMSKERKKAIDEALEESGDERPE